MLLVLYAVSCAHLVASQVGSQGELSAADITRVERSSKVACLVYDTDALPALSLAWVCNSGLLCAPLAPTTSTRKNSAKSSKANMAMKVYKHSGVLD